MEENSNRNYSFIIISRLVCVNSSFCQFQGLSIEQTYIAMMKQNEASYDDKAWMLFLISEIKLARELCREIHGILTTLYNAIKEIHNISESLKQILVMLCENQTPREWRNIWFGPTLATDYIRAFVNRANYIEKLYHQYMITASETAINEINLAEIFNVHAFLAVLKLTKSRSLQISTSELVISTNFNNKEIDPSAIKVSNLMVSPFDIYRNILNNFSYWTFIRLMGDFSSKTS